MDDEQYQQLTTNRKRELLYPELSYKIVGLAYKVNDAIGFGQTEKVYCDGLAKVLERDNIPYSREYYCPIKIDSDIIAKKYFDFIVDNKIILEVKVGTYKYKEACNQLFQYLKQSKLKLGMIIRFDRDGVKIKRIPCFY